MAGRSGPYAGYYQPPITQAPKTAMAIYQGVDDLGPVEQGRMSQGPISELSHFPSAPLTPRSSISPLEKFAIIPLPADNGYSKDVSESKPPSRYHKTKRLRIIIVGGFVVVGVIVGVAVGVTQSKNNVPANSGLVRVPNEVTIAVTTTATAAAAATATAATAATATTATAAPTATAPTTTTTAIITKATTIAATTTTMAGGTYSIMSTPATTTNTSSAPYDDGHAVYDDDPSLSAVNGIAVGF